MPAARSIAAAIALTVAPAVAQARGTPPDAHAALQKACQKMAWLQGLEFATSESRDNALIRQFGALRGGDVEITGRWTPDTVQLDVGADDDVVMHRGRTIARDADHDWVLRRDRLAGGGELPFVFDPGLFFDVLARVPARQIEVVRDETGADDQGSAERVITLTLDGDAARELANTGALPPVAGGSDSIIRIVGQAGGKLPEPELLTDIALHLDPVSHLVQRMRVKSYQESGFGGNVVVQVQGAGLGPRKQEEKSDDEAATDEQGRRKFAQGLPVRELDEQQSVTTFTVRFSKHDMPIVPQLDERARRLLRMSR